jgi:NADPH-dependent 2,4-dienoyl-CoA reductase/sulfur reductase-like enzyme
MEVHVVAPEARPLERILGADVGDFVRKLHEEKGVSFHLEKTATRVDETQVTLSDGSTLDAELVVLGVGVRPDLTLAEGAGLAVDKGILVDEHLMTSAPGVYAAGDAARFPDPRASAGPGDRLRIEHWVVAERQGQTAARNMLGKRVPYRDVPFFWSAHYDAVIAYVGHADPSQCAITVDGDLDARDAKVTYARGDETLAVATVFRDRDSLEAEAAMERRLR